MKHRRKGEGDSLSAAGLSDSNDVPPAKRHGPSLALDRGRRGEALGADGAHEVFRESDLRKGGHRAGNATALDLDECQR